MGDLILEPIQPGEPLPVGTGVPATPTSTTVYLAKRGHNLKCRNRDAMRRTTSWPSVASLPPVTLPIDWTRSNTLLYPYLDNDTLGDCYYAAALHLDQTWTGNNSLESWFNNATVATDYEALSGGDNGLSEDEIVGAWMTPNSLASTANVSILDRLDIDPTNVALMQSAIWHFGGVMFALALSESWYKNFDTGYTMDVPCIPDVNLGHAILLPGVSADGVYKIETWGTWGNITPAGVAACYPSAFVCFSLRWFDSDGVAPNGMTYDQLAAIWEAAGGKVLPPSPFIPSPVPTPIPTPTPVPTPVPTPTPTPVSADKTMLINFSKNTVTTQNITFHHTWNPKGVGTITIHEALGTMNMPQKDSINGVSFPD